jgi:hypothetical protein
MAAIAWVCASGLLRRFYRAVGGSGAPEISRRDCKPAIATESLRFGEQPQPLLRADHDSLHKCHMSVIKI